MLVCLCRRVSDRAVRSAIKDGARDVESISQKCGAGSRCGGCWPALEELITSVTLGASYEPSLSLATTRSLRGRRRQETGAA